ncbi:MAG: hypothetical protein JST80_01825 [Bdellovibrionales bacterium]|nr:hypothetical protein [Bdellovibrionales bacterium]
MKHTTRHPETKKLKVPPVKDIARLEGKVVDPIYLADGDLCTELDAIPRNEGEYTSELQYNGYNDVEDYDNSAYDLSTEKEKQPDPEKELHFDGRPETAHEGEEEDPTHLNNEDVSKI